MARLYEGRRTFLHPILRPIEVAAYRLGGSREESEQRWTQYTASLIAFSIFSCSIRLHSSAFAGMVAVEPAAFHSRASLSRSGVQQCRQLFHEYELAIVFRRIHLQLFRPDGSLTVQNFASAAAGIAVAIAVVRGFSRQQANSLGNFWVDITRARSTSCCHSVIVALFFCSQGVIQNFSPYTAAKTLEGATQVIAQGPVASQEAIKMLGTMAADSSARIRVILLKILRR